MKKKVFSKLLMVALVATVGAFTSCKDYDDDINDLRSQINGLETSLKAAIDKNATDASNSLALLEQQLEKVKTAYADADAALQKELDAAKETGKANAENIKTLLSEVAELKAAKISMEASIKSLQEGLDAAKLDIKANNDNIIGLLAKDKELEKNITDAKAAADNALSEAQKALAKANENATEISSLKTKEQADFDNLQKQISDNLTSVTAKIAEVNAALDKRITTNEGEIKTLKETAAANKADIATIKTKLTELSDKDAEILKALEEAKTALAKADKDAAEKQEKINDELQKAIKANEAAIQLINESTIPQLKEDLIKHVIPEEVAKQIDAILEDRLKTFLEGDVTDLVEEYFDDAVTLIDALEAKVDSLDDAMDKAIDLAFVLACAYAEDYTDSVATAKVGEIKQAYEAADKLVKDSVGKVAAALETVKDKIYGEAGLVEQISGLEAWFAPAAAAEGEEASGLLKYQEELLKSEAVIAKMNDIVAAATNEINDMITSINLFAGPHEDYHGDQDGTGYTEFDHDLNFTYAIEYETVFPEPALQPFVNDSIKFTEGYLHTYADSILVRVSPVNAVLDKDFIALINSQGEDVVASGIVNVDKVARYNRPAGEYLTRPGDQYLTRSNNGETGLWVIYFSLKDQDPAVWNKFKAAAYPKGDDGKFDETRKILYSVGVKNTRKDDAEDNRYVVSEYDLGLGTAKAFHVWDFDVNKTVVQKIHNRYIVNENKPNSTSAAKLWTDDNENFPESYNEELTYAPYAAEHVSYIFDSKYNYPDGFNAQCYRGIGSYVKDENGEYILDIFGEKFVKDYPGYIYQDLKKQKTADDEELTFNVTDRWGYEIDHRANENFYGYQGIDNRDNQKILTVNFDGDWATIDIEFPRVIDCYNSNGTIRSTEIGGFFVMLDQNFARESSTSEVSAWTQYIYEGVGFRSVNGFDAKTGEYIYDTTRNDEQAGIENGIKKATLFKGNKGAIKIKNARGAKGDVIGFRVFAVNLDGTLYDPDGRAFYVKVGDYSENQTLNFEVKVFNEKGDTATQKENIVAYNVAAAKDKKNPFFNMTQIELNKGTQYYFNWTWTEEDAEGNEVKNDVVRSSSSNYAVLPEDGSSEYISELFKFWYTDEETIDEETEWYTKYPYGYKSKFEGDVPVNNVAVELLDADRLLDWGTYHLKLEITKVDPDGAESLVNTIFVNVKKLMPNRPPKAFKLRDVQDKEVTFYMRPKGEDQSNIWNINGWFWNDEDIVASEYSNYGFDYFYKVDGKDHNAVVWPDGGLIKATRGASDNTWTDYRWATDVRPYNFEEIFHGLITTPASASVNNNPAGNLAAYLAQFDQNYSFYFPGCGSYADYQNADGYNTEDAVKAVNDTAVTYFRTDDKMNPKALTYKGLNTDKSAVVYQKMPGYYLPYIYYENVKENGKGVKVPVMVAYTYRNISFKKSGDYYVSGDFTTTPTYFKANGDATDKAGAEFNVKFECALDPTFKLGTAMKDSVRAYDANDWVAAGINGTAVNGKKKNPNLDKAINYGNKFQVTFDSLKVSWKSDKAAFETVDNKAASYFRTNFAEFAQNKWAGKFPTTEAAYYEDTCWVWAQSYGNYLYDNKYQRRANHIAIVDINKQPSIEAVELYIYKKADEEGNGTKADVDHYFEVKDFSDSENGIGSQYFRGGAFGNYGLEFVSKSTSLDPTKIHRMRIVVKTSTPKLVHQWGHTTTGTSTTREIWIKNPASTPHIDGARQSR